MLSLTPQPHLEEPYVSLLPVAIALPCRKQGFQAECQDGRMLGACSKCTPNRVEKTLEDLNIPREKINRKSLVFPCSLFYYY
jgi:hypothetical protein